jgi:hypothetical protein
LNSKWKSKRKKERNYWEREYKKPSMKKFYFFIIAISFLISCNETSENKSVGDSMEQDPQTGQPITTQPDTIGHSIDTSHSH